MPDKQRTFGQFETPPAVADLLLALCVRRDGDRVLDPSCGSGLLLARAARRQAWLGGDERAAGGNLWGVELDEATAAAARGRLPGVHILQQNFFTIEPGEPFDAVVGNPPYTRAEWFEKLQSQAAQQLALFGQAGSASGDDKSAIIPGELWRQPLSRRAGLHAYFILHGARFLREGGRFGFVLPNNWLDVGYGEGLKRFLLEQFKIIALIESTAERWFAEARVNTCLLIMEKCRFAEERAAQPVRFVQLRQPLAELLPGGAGYAAAFQAIERLSLSLLPAQDRTSRSVRIRVAQQGGLRARDKWSVLWRAPLVYRQARGQAARRNLAPLKAWATVRRGYTTGANAFFYLDVETADRWQIEGHFRRPLLKSLRAVRSLTPDAATDSEVLAIAPTAVLAGGVGAYVAWGESQGFDQRRTCRARQPWYALPYQEPARLALAKGIWERHLAPLLQTPLLIDQQLYGVAPLPGVALRVAAAILNGSWTALQMELQGRVNFGEGVLWLATYEVENLLLPDVRRLPPDVQQLLAQCFTELSAEVAAGGHDGAARRRLDDALFQVIGLSQTEAAIVLETLQERMAARQAAAQ